MTKNPFINALLAEVYVILVASLMFLGMDHKGADNTIIIPIAVLSLLHFQQP